MSSRTKFRRRATALAVLATIAAGIFAITASGDGPSEDTIVVEFTSARGLVEGNDVRINGAPAGQVTKMELTEDGEAAVTITLHDGLEAPRADASAAIRPVDLIGDNYVAFEPGSAEAPLAGTIPSERTLNEPRLDDLLRTFAEPEREALKLMLVEAGLALDHRGEDLTETALALRPALEAADRTMVELGSQEADLRGFIADAQRVSSQAAEREDDLGRLIGGLDATLAATATQSAALDQTLLELPVALPELRAVTTRLEAVARSATPLAATIERSAPQLARTLEAAGPFLAGAGDAARTLTPVVGEATELLDERERTIVALDDALGSVTDSAPAFNAFLDAFANAAPAISEGFFVNFPDQAAEPGTQPFDPFADPRRHYWRGAALLTCQSFGVPIEPGCLTRVLTRGGGERKDKWHNDGSERDPGSSSGSDGSADPGDGPNASGDEDADATPPSGVDPSSPVPATPGLPAPLTPPSPSGLDDLMGFLLG